MKQILNSILRVSAALSRPSPFSIKVQEDACMEALPQIRQYVLRTLNDCMGIHVAKLQYKVYAARSPKELWMLRSDIYQLVSHSHSQQVAADRINALLPYFENWIPQRQLTRI
jgi:hypothetical protein